MLATIERGLERLAVWLAAAGALIIVVQTVWISYGVFMRYVVGKPDGTVTEATALLLFPAALLGLAFALKENAYPKVSFLIDALGPRGARRPRPEFTGRHRRHQRLAHPGRQRRPAGADRPAILRKPP